MSLDIILRQQQLVCEPNDLLVRTPDKNQFYPENHPLQKLKPKLIPIDVQQTLSAIPYKDLVEIGNEIKEMQKQESKPAAEANQENASSIIEGVIRSEILNVNIKFLCNFVFLVS
ncbi:MAG: hypothetical protein WCK78_08230 [Paludibacter sp.]